ncbi:SidA/IucD/PvdA family monooxygenase [Kribbella sp. NPDC055110]
MSDQLLRYFGPTPANWVRTTGFDHDAVVVGAGQSGLGIGFALRRGGIGRATVVDAAAPGEAGVWTTTARMRTLRTPKAWPEPEFGFPELSFRAWYEGLHGEAAYDELARIPRTAWAEYVAWFERTVEVAVRHHTRLIGVTPAEDHLVLRFAVTRPDGRVDEVVETTRKLVLANGVEGTGGPVLPAPFVGLPNEFAAHTGDRIDFAALAGRSVGVLGAGASALDAAGAALEAGASEVHLFTRRPELMVQAPGAGSPQGLGARENFHRRSDADRWSLKVAAARAGRSCTLESVERAAAFGGFRVHLSAPWHDARVAGGKVHVDAADGSHLFDFVIAGTGYQYDPHTRPELAEIADHVALWADRYQPPSELADESLGSFPYLGDGYELVEKHAGTAAWAGRIHVFSAAAGLSFGIPVGDVQSLATGIPRLVDAIGRDLFLEDQHLPAPATPAPPKPESLRAAYDHAIWRVDLVPADR